MKKNTSKITLSAILIFIFIVLLSFTLVSCKPQSKVREDKTVYINNESDFKNVLAKNLGEDYSRYTYEIKSDLDFTNENWSPIASQEDEFFMGKIDGKGHTIKYKIHHVAKTPDGLIDAESLDDNSYYSLIAKARNAQAKNLNVEVDISYDSSTKISYASGLIGRAVDSVVLDNISVKGKIVANMPVFGRYNYDYDDIADQQILRKSNLERITAQYLGGIVGYAFHNAKITNSSSLVNLSALKSENAFGNRIFIGGIVAYVRPTEAKNGSVESDIENSSYDGSIQAVGEHVSAASAVGYSERLKLSKFTAKPNVKIDVSFDKTLKLGGLIGKAIGTRIEKSKIEKGAELKSKKIPGTANENVTEASSIGGLVGYLYKNSEINNCIAYIDIIAMESKKYYIGGLAGSLFDSNIEDCVVEGDLKVSDTKTLKEYEFNFETNESLAMSTLKTIMHSSSLVGQIGYKASLQSIVTKFNAFRAASGEKHDNMKNFSVDEDILSKDPKLEGYLKSRGYYPYDDFVEKVVAQPQSESQREDKVVSCSVFIKISSSNVNYSSNISKYETIKAHPKVVQLTKDIEPLEFGSALDESEIDAKFNDLKLSIENKINS